MRSFLVARSPSHSHSFACAAPFNSWKQDAVTRQVINNNSNKRRVTATVLPFQTALKQVEPSSIAPVFQSVHHSWKIRDASIFCSWRLALRSVCNVFGHAQFEFVEAMKVSRSRESCVNPIKLDSTKQWCFWSRHLRIYDVISNRCLSLEQCLVLNGWDAPN